MMSDDTALRSEFDRFDTDRNGYIDATEFTQLVAALGIRFSEEQSMTAFLAIDVSGNDRIEFGEFRAWWSKHRPHR